MCNAHAKDPSIAISSSPIHSNDLPVKTDVVAPLALGAALAAVFFSIKEIIKSKKMNKGPAPGQSAFDATLNANLDGREYRMALARTRQAVAVHRAIGFLNTGNTARSMVELRRALHENSVCRAPMINTQYSLSVMHQLYRMHLENSTVPSDFATLLQLRTLLDLDFEDAENIEKEIMEQGSAYSI